MFLEGQLNSESERSAFAEGRAADQPRLLLRPETREGGVAQLLLAEPFTQLADQRWIVN
jgi:hypothetical protein